MKASATDAIVEIKGELNCQTAGIIYCITCKKCMMQYIGTSKLTAQARLSQHVGYIRNKHLNQPTGKHFNGRGHSLSDLSFVILEKVFSKDVLLREGHMNCSAVFPPSNFSEVTLILVFLVFPLGN